MEQHLADMKGLILTCWFDEEVLMEEEDVRLSLWHLGFILIHEDVEKSFVRMRGGVFYNFYLHGFIILCGLWHSRTEGRTAC